MFRLVGLTLVAITAFAANSVLARLALGSGTTDAGLYTGVRLISGALVLMGLVSLRPQGLRAVLGAGSWAGAGGLCAYALAFSFAYVALGAGTGALILFSSVQFTMLGWSMIKGEMPGPLEWLGIGLALLAFGFLVWPGLTSPEPLAAGLMVVAGISWAVYSLVGRGSSSPLLDTAANFLRSVPLALLLIGLGLLQPLGDWQGLAWAILSGAVASGLGYAVWYSALPGLQRKQAAIVQLSVPALAALGGVLFLQETLTTRLLLCSAAILGGVLLAIVASERRRRTGASPA
ncbi:DMT family transporter [Devosia sp.]|uniref:DMT family transporter n=1 Tax=Devosia sp. TaxID=1871048 RepID=UPI0019DB590D|nr:DMT family transporter [Devosia sp.]MBE0578256.1 DMT family transporter [Devosia sp.]